MEDTWCESTDFPARSLHTDLMVVVGLDCRAKRPSGFSEAITVIEALGGLLDQDYLPTLPGVLGYAIS